MVGYLGDTILSIAILCNTNFEFEFKKNILNKNIQIFDKENSYSNLSGLIILSKEIDQIDYEIILKSLEMKIPILALMDGFDSLNIFLGGKDPIFNQNKNNESILTQYFLSPGSKISHIIGGSGWIKANFNSQKKLFQKDLSEHFFASILSESGNIIGYEKPGENWVFGLRFNVLDDSNPKGFEKLLSVFLDKCNL
jgi:gamma-glutamyl-gamma-aminobutyrate hydrolase PuuD